MDRVPLFNSKKERLFVYTALIGLFLIHLSFIYKDYKEFISLPFFYTKAEVIESYFKTKNSKKYQVLKLKVKNLGTIWTTTPKIEPLEDKILRIKLYPDKNLSFLEYLRGFFSKSKILEIYPNSSLRVKLKHLIYSQHKNQDLASLFSAIFLATPVKKSVRERVSLFGINHLIALSGFHLGIISSAIALILLPIYRPLQSRFFPWRYSYFDLGLFSMVILFGYLYLTDFPPSLVRAYFMIVIAWLAFIFWIELISFEFLLFSVLIILVVFPEFIVSLSFWFSVGGVFYIFLLLKYIKNPKVLAFFLPILIYVLMFPIAHSIFDKVSIYQLISPVLSWLFIPFYPLIFTAHLVGFGGVFDNFLQKSMALDIQSFNISLPREFLYIYTLLSFIAIKNRLAFYVTLLFAILTIFYFYIYCNFFLKI